MFDRFSDHAKHSMNAARSAAHRLNHEYLGTEHILLGLLDQTESVAADVLRRMRLDLSLIRSQVENRVAPGAPARPVSQIPFTPRAKRVLELAFEEAATLGHDYIGTEHLLLGLIREGDGIAGQALKAVGVELDETRRQVRLRQGEPER